MNELRHQNVSYSIFIPYLLTYYIKAVSHLCDLAYATVLIHIGADIQYSHTQ